MKSLSLSQSETLGALLNGQQQHVSQLLVALVSWKVQLVKARGKNGIIYSTCSSHQALVLKCENAAGAYQV